MGKFKAGDKVRVREWDNMAKEFGVDLVGNIECRPTFVDNMKCYCGGVYKILGDTRTSYVLEGAGGYFFSEETLFPAITYREYAEKLARHKICPDYYGGVSGCPIHLPYIYPKHPGYCEYPNCSDEACGKCWDRYITEREYEVYKKYVNDEVEEGEKEMKFRKGDYVKVVKATDGDGASWVSRMDKTIGEIYKIKQAERDKTCKLEGVDFFWFPFEALEPATPKDMLYPFCTVKMRNGNVYLFDGKNMLLREGRWLDTDDHDENLNSSFGDDFDVMDICAPSDHVTELLELLTKRGECIWKREEVVEISAEEAAKKLKDQYPGQTVKIVC